MARIGLSRLVTFRLKAEGAHISIIAIVEQRLVFIDQHGLGGACAMIKGLDNVANSCYATNS